VLQVGVHHAQNRCISVSPSGENRAGEATLAFAYEQAHARIFMVNGDDDLLGAVAAVIIHHDDLVKDTDGVKHGADVTEKARQVFGLAQGWNDQRQVLLGVRILISG